MISFTPARLTGSASGHGSPNDSMTASGRYARARSTAGGPADQHSNPAPHRKLVRSVTMASSLSSQYGSPRRPPQSPSPPPLETAAASAPPAAPPIGAETIGCSMENSSVKEVTRDMPTALPHGSGPDPAYRARQLAYASCP